MRKASFSVEKVSSNTDAHNSREHSPRYLIGCEKGKENEYIKYYDYDNFQQLAEARYLEVNKQKMQNSQKEALFEEAVISLEEHHTKDDVIKLFEALNQKYTGHTLINLAIHRDEGHFVKDGIEYYPTMHILQKDDGNWYILDENDTHILEALNDKNFKPKAEDFKIKVNINDFEKVYNYHAHAVFSRFDLETGKSARFQKKDMSERYKFVAEQMQMNYAPDTKDRFVKKSINQHKVDLSATRNAKLVLKKELEAEHLKEMKASKKEITNLKSQNTKNKNEKEKLKEANKALEMQLKELNTQLQSQLSNREQHAQREALVKELKEELKNKTLTTETMQSKFAELEEKLLKEKGHLESVIEVKEIDILELKNAQTTLNKELQEVNSQCEFLNFNKKELEEANKALQEQKTVLEGKVTTLEEKIVSSSNMNDSELKKELQNIINDEIEVKSVKTGVFSTEEAPVIKNSKSFLQKIQDLTVQGTKKIKSEFEALKTKYNDLVFKFNALTKENLELKEKVKQLESEAPKQQKEKSKDHLKEIVEQMEAYKGDKSDSSIILNKSKELTLREKFEAHREVTREQIKEDLKETKEEKSNSKKRSYGRER